MLTRDEELLLFESMQKAIEPRVKDLKGEYRQEVMELYDSDGIDRKALRVDGEKAGYVSVRHSKPKAAIDPNHENEALSYLLHVGLADIVPSKGWEKRFAKAPGGVVDVKTGELVDWAVWEPGRPLGAMVKVDREPSEVFEMLKPKIAGASLPMLLRGETE